MSLSHSFWVCRPLPARCYWRACYLLVLLMRLSHSFTHTALTWHCWDSDPVYSRSMAGDLWGVWQQSGENVFSSSPGECFKETSLHHHRVCLFLSAMLAWTDLSTVMALVPRQSQHQINNKWVMILKFYDSQPDSFYSRTSCFWVHLCPSSSLFLKSKWPYC